MFFIGKLCTVAITSDVALKNKVHGYNVASPLWRRQCRHLGLWNIQAETAVFLIPSESEKVNIQDIRDSLLGQNQRRVHVWSSVTGELNALPPAAPCPNGGIQKTGKFLSRSLFQAIILCLAKTVFRCLLGRTPLQPASLAVPREHIVGHYSWTYLQSLSVQRNTSG